MKKFITNFFDITFWKFIIVGVANTLFGSFIMFFLYNFVHCNYWISSAANYFFGSILSYFLNKNFTFKNKSKNPKVILKFICNILICYGIAYGVAKPVVKSLLASSSVNIQDNLSMLVGMGLFVILNYIGQRFFTFTSD